MSGDRLREAAREMLRGGEHDGPCTNVDEPDSSCDLHVAASEARRNELREALAADERGGVTWEQMYAEHVAVAKVIHDRSGDDDPHAFGRETASCDWLADQFLEATNGGGGEGLADLARSACIGIHARDHGNEPLSFDECPVDYCADARARLAAAQPASHAAEPRA